MDLKLPTLGLSGQQGRKDNSIVDCLGRVVRVRSLLDKRIHSADDSVPARRPMDTNANTRGEKMSLQWSRTKQTGLEVKLRLLVASLLPNLRGSILAIPTDSAPSTTSTRPSQRTVMSRYFNAGALVALCVHMTALTREWHLNSACAMSVLEVANERVLTGCARQCPCTCPASRDLPMALLTKRAAPSCSQRLASWSSRSPWQSQEAEAGKPTPGSRRYSRRRGSASRADGGRWLSPHSSSPCRTTCTTSRSATSRCQPFRLPCSSR